MDDHRSPVAEPAPNAVGAGRVRRTLRLLLALVAPPLLGQDTLAQRHRPADGALRLDAAALRELRVSAAFAYVGGHRFILGGIADAEQHFFVHADSAGIVQRLYWLQIEELLPSRSGAYSYASDSVVTVNGFGLAANFRTYASPPESGSDRARALTFLAARGYSVPEGATRVRLVYLPDAAARREVMIIYLESSAGAQADSHASLLARATADLTLHGMR